MGINWKRLEFGFPLALLVGLAVRVVWVLLCPNEPTSDQFLYHQAAIDLAAGRGYVDASGDPANYWPVGYSALLVPFYLVFGPAPLSAYTANTLLALLSITGVFLLARELFEHRVASWTALALALYPTLVMYTTCVASENAFIPGVVWLVYLFLRLAKAENPWLWIVLSGVVAAATAYVRATVGLVCLVLPIWTWWHRSFKSALFRGAGVAVLIVLLLLPWAFRNQAHFDAFTPFSLNGSANLWMGNHPGSDGGYHPLPSDVHGMTLNEREEVLGQRARTFIAQNPGTFLWLSLRRTFVTLRSDTIAVVWNQQGIERRLGGGLMVPLKILCSGAHLLFLGLALLGLVRGLWKSARQRQWQLERGHVLIVLLMGLLAVPFVFIVSGNRYHLPLIPFTLLLALSMWIPSKSEGEA